MTKDFHQLQGQPDNLLTDSINNPEPENCYLCEDAIVVASIKCSKCQRLHHPECANNPANVNTWLCNECQPEPMEPRALSSPASNISSTVSNPTCSAMQSLELQRLEEERALAEIRDREYLCKKYKILQQLSNTAGAAEVLSLQPIGADPTTNLNYNRVTTSKNKNQHSNVTTIYNISSMLASTSNNLPIRDHQPATSQQNNSTQATNDAHVNINSNQQPQQFAANTQMPTQFFPNLTSSYEHPHAIADGNITIEQLHARHTVPKELPLFSGHPEDWPLFNSTYEWSTTVCGLTDAENLVRLQRSLRGDAMEAVQHILIHPSCVPHVISTLKVLYGQPEKILFALKNRVKKLPPISLQKMETLTNFAVHVKGLQSTIEACGLLDELTNSTLLQELVSKLPPYYQINWGSTKLNLQQNNKKVSLIDFSNWIFDIGLSASCVNVEHTLTTNPEKQRNPKQAFIHTHEEQKKRCVICRESCNHAYNCHQFLSADRNERWNLVRKYELCKHCLRKHYGVCSNKNKICNVDCCQLKHHYLLHGFKSNIQRSVDYNDREPSEDKSSEEYENANVKTINTHTSQSQNVLFKILPITIYGKHDKLISTFALLDDGSSLSLIEEDVLKELDVSGEIEPLCLKWTSNYQRVEKNSQRTSIRVFSSENQNISLRVRSVKKLSLPKQTLNYKTICQRFQYLSGLHVQSYEEAIPKVLIGLDNTNVIISRKIREGKPNQPVAVKTALGWTIFGPCYNTNQSQVYNFHMCECMANDVEIHNLVKHFYSTENLGVKVVDISPNSEDEKSFQLLEKFTKQRKDGHYETCLLWRFEDVTLPESLEMAKKRLLCLEKKLLGNQELLTTFQNTIDDYVRKGYVSKLTKIKPSPKIWYLPIFPVFNKNKPGKCRIVWDAAAKSNGVSLNSMLYKGPDLLSSLIGILFQFRERSVAICADIEQMFHQVVIRDEDRQAQRFLWRNCDSTKDPEIYVMNVMIFGASCAPSISQFIKNKNADKYKVHFPESSAVIQNNHYVDDLLYSVDSVQQAIKVATEVRYIQKQAGMNLRNWTSNKSEVVKILEASQQPDDKLLNIGIDNAVEKVLGVFWNPSTDIITFKISPYILNNPTINDGKHPTKREVLKLLMTFYDPLGLIGNFLMFLKITLQKIWRSGVTWDEPIKEEELSDWNKWIQYLPQLEKIVIPRCYLKTISEYSNTEVQLHIFVDASENGYAAVAYLRLVKETIIECSLVGSKTRVFPLKMVSVPRLELMAALIGVRFANTIIQKHSIKINTKFFWSDSKTVLSWLSYGNRKYHQFVALRVSEILETTEPNEWHWISGKLNVADEATKWAKRPDISPDGRWFRGPEFLSREECKWPTESVIIEPCEIEVRKTVLLHVCEDRLIDTNRFSNWTKLLRTAAFVLRYCNRLRDKGRGSTNKELSSHELMVAEVLLFKLAQAEHYLDEINTLTACDKLKKPSTLFKVNVQLDNNGLLRVHGRLDKANVPEEIKHPIVLPRESRITFLLILNYHNKFHHLNHETVVNEVRQLYYIPRLRAVLKSVRKSCQSCLVNNASPRYPQMSQVPEARLGSFCPPFTYTGLDYFGPMSVSVNRRIEKRYGALFTCLTIRAVHIEIVNTLNTSSCIMAIRNFICRRGTPREIYSDNGTNFIGSEREIREALKEIDKNEIFRNLTTTNTKWIFIPPSSPHMGGAWERLVRSVKTILYRITPTRVPNEELLRGMLLEVENIINTRPLTYVPIDNDNGEALTPNHFLLGSSNGMKPLATYDDTGIALKHNWLYCQQYADTFWRRWIKEYLPTLIHRPKWHSKTKPLEVGDLVIVVDPSNPRNVWPRGRILKTSKSEDGQVRSASVLTSKGILVRPAVRLAVIDVAKGKV